MLSNAVGKARLAPISTRLRSMPSGIRVADETAGTTASRAGLSPRFFIHAAIPWRMNSANPRTVWRQLPAATSCLKASYRAANARSEEHTSELQSPDHLVCRLLLEKKNIISHHHIR